MTSMWANCDLSTTGEQDELFKHWDGVGGR
jgi:hypothetical protein